MKKAHIVERHHSALYYYGNKVFWNYIIFLCILRVLWKLYFSCSAVGSVVTFGTVQLRRVIQASQVSICIFFMKSFVPDTPLDVPCRYQLVL